MKNLFTLVLMFSSGLLITTAKAQDKLNVDDAYYTPSNSSQKADQTTGNTETSPYHENGSNQIDSLGNPNGFRHPDYCYDDYGYYYGYPYWGYYGGIWCYSPWFTGNYPYGYACWANRGGYGARYGSYGGRGGYGKRGGSYGARGGFYGARGGNGGRGGSGYGAHGAGSARSGFGGTGGHSASS